MDNNIANARRNFEARAGIKFTQQDAANTFGVSIGTYRNWEQGVNLPKAAVASHMAKLYGVTINYLLGMSDEPIVATKERVMESEETEVIDMYRAMSEEQRAALLVIMRSML